MTEIIKQAIIILRNDTSTNWSANNPVLKMGEVGVETDTHFSKTGDGTSHWNDLQYNIIPGATSTDAGSVTTGAQTFAGAKTFSGGVIGNVTGNVSGSSGSCTGNAATATTASKTDNSLTLKINSGTTEGTNKYTFDGSAAKTVDITAGSNVTLTATSGNLSISSTDTNTTYTLSQDSSDGHKITLTPSTGSATTITIPDNDTITAIASTTGSGNAVTSISASNGQLTVNKETSFAVLDSPAFTGTPTAPTANVGTNTTQLATTAFVKAEINEVLSAADAMVFKGTLGTGGTISTLPTTGYKVGWTYRVITAGTYASKVCEIGDMIVCIKKYVSPGSDDDWTVIQNNLDGAVIGPPSSVENRIATYSGTSGKVIKDSGVILPNDPKFTDTVTTISSTTGSGNAITSITASNGQLSIVKDTVFLTSHQTVTNNAPTLSWGTTSTIGSVGGTNLTVTMPSNPSTSYSAGDGLTLTGTTFSVNFGNTSTTVCAGNDSRLSDSRTPTAHNQAETTITFTDVTTNNASTSKHGFLPKLGGGTSNYLRADGTWSTPPDTTYSVATTSADGLMSSTDKTQLTSLPSAITVSYSAPTSADGDNGDIWYRIETVS